MIIFNQSGRLGNQLFQYAGLKTLGQTNETLVLLGFEALQSTFNGIEAKIINTRSSKVERYLSYRFYEWANYLSQKNIIQRVKQAKASINLFYNSSLLKTITVVEQNYFQSESFFDPSIVKSLVLKPELLAFAKQSLEQLPLRRIPIYVHVRRGDYLNWPDKENSAVLPNSYYRKCINLIKADIPDAFFVFTSDEPDYIKATFGDLDNFYISTGTAAEDFALMTQCQGGILSASSFAWWAAYFARLWQNSSVFLAPKYWAGHSKQQWYPAFIKSSFLTYVEV
ncbi:alpha-1,2-fucosyltransferase [Leptolyngbya sp. CCNP1308]|uniref:alpha-1,2-fucosyltransferase n=1 Tax=Leptolyngbya sp. CCNP1308 TaxID=3110255 RepID=UPI002B216C90|nr:alpha-1,2-fucosyltransferase [Leptolyngbya sp. CCNP1308]MEA5452265.1 alpha-1,2-fucosyltransferase [Leptolyngbya sp. CCNP1308]